MLLASSIETENEVDRRQYAYKGEEWVACPKAETFIRNLIEDFLKIEKKAQDLASRLETETSTSFWDWVDHIKIGGDEATIKHLEDLGFVNEIVPSEPGTTVFRHKVAHLPRIVINLRESSKSLSSVAIKCDSVEDIRKQLGTQNPIEGTMGGPYCRTLISTTAGNDFLAVARHGHRGMVPLELKSDELAKIEQARSIWAKRNLQHEDDAKGMAEALECAKKMVALVGPDVATDVAFEVIRAHWEARNKAGQIQKKRQDKFGLGWANHDHHTFRSSRQYFGILIEILETFGFFCRERFYAGEDAGWGAQVIEQPVTGIVIFADVDLAPEEVDLDFGHTPLSPLSKLGTVGLWCGLHGESMLQAGMHHLEIQCSFDQFRKDGPTLGIEVMNPFNNEEHLRQAFTVGERWQINRNRVETLLSKKLITKEQADEFLAKGAIGSHLEHLWRGGGFKGFKKNGVSAILKEVDPRYAKTI
jgi:hypothetical protein